MKPSDDKIDPVTALQDAIDGLSLAMFEALRGLRDAVAPESGNLGGNNNNNISTTTAAAAGANTNINFQTSSSSSSAGDIMLVQQLAKTVLQKSDLIHEHVQNCIPGMHRTRTEQLQYIEQLVAENQATTRELEQFHQLAQDRRDKCREFIRKQTSQVLGIEEDFADD